MISLMLSKDPSSCCWKIYCGAAVDTGALHKATAIIQEGVSVAQSKGAVSTGRTPPPALHGTFVTAPLPTSRGEGQSRRCL